MSNNLNPRDKVESLFLGICLVSMLLYLFNVIAGKLAAAQIAQIPHMGDVHEFITLTISVSTFIFWTIRREALSK